MRFTTDFNDSEKKMTVTVQEQSNHIKMHGEIFLWLRMFGLFRVHEFTVYRKLFWVEFHLTDKIGKSFVNLYIILFDEIYKNESVLWCNDRNTSPYDFVHSYSSFQ